MKTLNNFFFPEGEPTTHDVTGFYGGLGVMTLISVVATVIYFW